MTLNRTSGWTAGSGSTSHCRVSSAENDLAHPDAELHQRRSGVGSLRIALDDEDDEEWSRIDAS